MNDSVPDATPRRIAFCITELDPGGAERALVDIVTRLPRDQWDSHVFCLGPEAPLAKTLRDAGIPVTCLGARSGRDLLVVDRLRRALRRWKPELLQTFLFHANVAGRLAGWLAGVPVIVSGLRVAERSHSWHNWLERWTGGLAMQHVAVSEGVGDFARTQLRFPAERVTIIPNGVNVAEVEETPPLDWAEIGLPSTANVLLGIGRLHPQKGFDLLIEAAAPLLRSRPNCALVIAGEGPQRAELESQVAHLGLVDRVLLPGWTPQPVRYLKAARLFVLSSRWEGMPNVLLQALASRTPVLATDVEGVADVMGELAPKQVVQSGSVSDLRAGLERALSADGAKPEASEQLYLFLSKSFTCESISDRYGQLYTRLLPAR